MADHPRRRGGRQLPMSTTTGDPSGAGKTAAYAFRTEVLERWAREHLQVRTGDDGRIEARFRYEGRSCGGISFDILFDIALQAEERGHRVLSSAIVVPGGYKSYRTMCEHRLNGEYFVEDMVRDKTFAGRLLEEALGWEPDMNPAGCLCESAHRNYKWRMALQTLHYHLTQKGNA